ncbi:MAG: alpha/beta hydrolase [Pseudomonadales bacterium]
MYTFLIISFVLIAIYLGVTRSYQGPDQSQYDSPQDPLIKPAAEISSQHDEVVAKLKAFHKQSGVKIADQRQRMEELFFQEVDAKIIPVDVDGVPGEWVLGPNSDPDRRLLYIHGGAFRVGSPRSHRYITAELARRAGIAVLAIDYRMQPEYKIVACHEDSQTAYRWILDHSPEGKSPAEQVFVAGDSAGGNLTLSVIAWARDQGLTKADGAIALAPLTDATMSSPTWASNQDSDPFLGPSLGQMMKLPRGLILLAQRFASGLAPNHPMLSPLLGNLKNLPPTLIQASADEVLYGDAQRYANKARQAGSEVTLQLWPKLVHVFQGFGPELPEARDALELMASFIGASQKVARQKNDDKLTN